VVANAVAVGAAAEVGVRAMAMGRGRVRIGAMVTASKPVTSRGLIRVLNREPIHGQFSGLHRVRNNRRRSTTKRPRCRLILRCTHRPLLRRR
jgi:hypothetical protein